MWHSRSRAFPRAASTPAGLVLLVLAFALAAGPLARAQGPSGSPDPLAATLLVEADLPGYAGRDLGDEAGLDIDRRAFDANRGMDVRIRAWASQDQGVVFDHRMLFPTDEAALAYLAAAEPTLSEADDAGLVLDLREPLTPGTRHWAGEVRIGGQDVAMDVWLIPVGPVVAKVAATVFGPGLATRRAIAERALARLEAAYGPAAPAPGSPVDSGSPSAAGASAASDIELVQELVQAVLRTGARGCEGDALEPGLPGEVVAVSCEADEVVVVYRQFVDGAARDAAFASLVEQLPEPDPTIASCADGAYQGVVTEGDRSWSVACWATPSGLALLWTEPDQPVLGAILAPPLADLVGRWEAARFVAPGA